MAHRDTQIRRFNHHLSEKIIGKVFEMRSTARGTREKNLQKKIGFRKPYSCH
jgi:hypothetical protein